MDLVNIIIPIHNQAHHIKNIISGYENQTLKPSKIIMILDRCTDNSIEICSEIKSSIPFEWYVKNEGTNFSAGMTRDFGLEKSDSEYVIFTDGDCYPSPELVEKHLECLKYPFPIISCGKRYLETEDGKIENDERCLIDGSGFIDDVNGRVMINTERTQKHIMTYSCNLGMNKKALEVCKSSNDFLVGSKRVFNPIFDGTWGGEDNLISYQVSVYGGYISLCDSKCFVTHKWHVKSDKTDVIEKQQILKILLEKIKLANIDGIIREKDIIETRRKRGYTGEIDFCNFDRIYSVSSYSQSVMNYYNDDLTTDMERMFCLGFVSRCLLQKSENDQPYLNHSVVETVMNKVRGILDSKIFVLTDEGLKLNNTRGIYEAKRSNRLFNVRA